MSSRSHAQVQLAVVLLAWLYISGLHWQNDGLWFQGDAPRHAATGLFWKDFLLSGSLSPQDYALRYYARYPVINPASYPPVFYLLEGVVFTVFHPSPYAAKCLVLAFALFAACYLMAWLRRWVAVEAGWAAALLPLLPGFALWSNAVMLNVPATALSLAALYHARRWIEALPGPVANRQLYLAAAFSVCATLTYFPAGILVLVIVAWVLISGRWTLLWHVSTVCAAMMAAALLLPFLYVAFKWAPIHVSFVTESITRFGVAADWNFYLRELPELTGPYPITVALFGLTIGMFRRRWRQESLWLLVFFLVTYLALSVIAAKEGRYALLLCIPVVCLCAMAVESCSRWLSRWLERGEMLSSLAALAAGAALCGMQAKTASNTSVPRLQGFRGIVTFVESVAPSEPVFYDGYYNNVFTFHVQAGDPEYKRRVVLGAKLLYASAINPMWHYRSDVLSKEDVVKTLQTRGGCRWLAIETSEQSREVPAATLLREAIKGPHFELVRSFPASGPGLDRIELYRFKLNPQPADEADLPFPILGDEVRFKVRPIQR